MEKALNPIISIVMSFYRPSTKSIVVFEKAIENILNQTFTNFEFIIFNDKGDDQRAIEFARSLRDPRVIFVDCPQNSGGLHAKRYNEGFKMARGQYLFHAFEDDVIYKDALEKLYIKIKESQADIVYAKTIIHTAHQKLIFGAPSGDIMRYNFIPNNLILHTKEMFEQTGGYPEARETIEVCDWEWWKKALEMGYKTSFIPEILGEVLGPMFGTNLRKGK